MKKNIINPWKWQDQLGYAQAVEVRNNSRTLYCAGQAAMDAAGKPTNGSMTEQINLCLDNLEQVIAKAGYPVASLIRLNIYTTNISEFFSAYGALAGWLANHQITPASTLVEVSALAFPELKVELEATLAD